MIAGLKCAPQISAKVWIRKNRASVWTSPITAKSWNGVGAPGTLGMAAGAYRTTDAQIANTSAKVPTNSAM